jgi:hypothetical protein
MFPGPPGKHVLGSFCKASGGTKFDGPLARLNLVGSKSAVGEQWPFVSGPAA